MSVFLSLQKLALCKTGYGTPKYPGETLFLKAHIYKSNTLNGSGRPDCDEHHRRRFWQLRNVPDALHRTLQARGHGRHVTLRLSAG
jgi:hypothetical protein